MDDKNFDLATAEEWISVIEAPGARARDNDLYPLISRWLAKTTGRVLDIGCGQGACAKCVTSEREYFGIDPSSRLIERATEVACAPNRNFQTGNAYQIPFAAKHFGAAFSIAVWHLLTDVNKASSELSRVLKDQGSFLIVTADPAQYTAWTDRYQNKKFEGMVFTGSSSFADGSSSMDVFELHSLNKIVDTLEHNGLKVTETTTFRMFIAISGIKI